MTLATTLPLSSATSVKSLTVLADYGTGDLAFQEVLQRLRLDFPTAAIDTLSVPSFSTQAIGFSLAQLALNPGLPGRVYYHNCAPRKDNLQARENNDGEGLTLVLLPNNVIVVGVNSGYSLSFIKEHALLLKSLNVPSSGSQFRSRDIFPTSLARLLNGETSLLGADIPLSDIPDPPTSQLLWVDGYGNLKTSLSLDGLDLQPGEEIYFKLGNTVKKALFADGSFSVPEGVLAFSPGSSGWLKPGGKQRVQWMELFLRGGNAWEAFDCPVLGESIIQLRRWQEVFSGAHDSFSWAA